MFEIYLAGKIHSWATAVLSAWSAEVSFSLDTQHILSYEAVPSLFNLLIYLLMNSFCLLMIVKSLHFTLIHRTGIRCSKCSSAKQKFFWNQRYGFLKKFLS